jgi:hypothetical protein
MAIYYVDPTSATTILNGIEAALSAAGVLTTTHNKTTADLIVTTTRSSKVIRYTIATMRVNTRYGDSWTSGTTLVNPYDINIYATGTAVDVQVVVTDKVILVGSRQSTTAAAFSMIGNLDNATNDPIIWGWTANVASGYLRQTSDQYAMGINTFRNTMISPDDKFYLSDIICMNAGSKVISTAVHGVKSLYRGGTVDPVVAVSGNHAIVAGGGILNASTDYMGQSLLINNGNSWVPA